MTADATQLLMESIMITNANRVIKFAQGFLNRSYLALDKGEEIPWMTLGIISEMVVFHSNIISEYNKLNEDKSLGLGRQSRL